MTRRTTSPYLRALRRKSALSQEDVAFLLGTFTGTRVSRHETGACDPPLEIVLAYEIIFGTGAADIYEDVQLQLASDIRKRAHTLRSSLAHRLTDRMRHEKRATLAQIIKRCKTN